VSPVRYELGFLSQKTTFFIVTAVKTSKLAFYSSGLIFRVQVLVFPNRKYSTLFLYVDLITETVLK
jgi:hypothetical protein